jgi:phosphatidylserine/phosphatidylglycerophosphate/cardiolipin synthase-like enzyme
VTRLQIQVPVTRFAVAYEIGEARPYSVFERLLLQAITEGVSNLDLLAASFAVPARLVIEGVVTLIKAGWVGLRSEDNGLVPTPVGQAAVASGAPPTTLAVQRPYPLHVVMDRATGAFCRNTDVTLVRDKDLDAPSNGGVVRLAADINDNHIDTGDVRPLLRPRPGQWIRWISPEAQLISKSTQSAVGFYDTVTGRLSNLPDSFRVSLEPALLARYGGPRSTYIPEQRLPSDVRRCRIALSEESFLVNAPQHQALLAEALETAAAHIIVCSAFIARSVLEGLAESLGAALKRGVTVDLLWGYSGSTADVASALDLIKKLQYDNRAASGVLSYNREASGSHAKLLIWDTEDAVNACVGSYNWLSAGAGPMGELSVRITHPSLVADLARFVADRWSEIPGAALDVAQRRWHQLASSWEQMWVDDEAVEAGTIASLVFGRAHEAALRRAVVDARPGVLVVVSHRAAAVGARRLLDGRGIERAEFVGALVVGEFLSDITGQGLNALAAELGLRFLQRPVHAKLLIHGDSVLIGSYNYLSADPPSRGGRARELSVRLDGAAARKLVEARLPEVWRPEGA